jgi:hypothetical protein
MFLFFTTAFCWVIYVEEIFGGNLFGEIDEL